MNPRTFPVSVVLMSLLMLSGCLRSRPSRFYTLHAALTGPAPATAPVMKGGMTLGVGPIRLPGYMDRSQIVTRLDRNEVRLSEFNRWAEGVAGRVQDIMEDNLGALLAGAEVRAYTRHRQIPLTHQLVVDIGDFIGEPDGEALLTAEWRILDLETPEKEAFRHAGTYRRRAPGPDYNDVVSAMSLLLGDLCEDIARDLLPAIGDE